MVEWKDLALLPRCFLAKVLSDNEMDHELAFLEKFEFEGFLASINAG